EIRDNMNTVARMINQAESVRSQLLHLKTVVGDDEPGKALASSTDALEKKIDELDKKIVGIEPRLFNMTVTGRGQDLLRTPSQMIEKLAHLAEVVSLGDFKPTDQQLEVHATLKKEIAALQDQLQQLVKADLAAFNTALHQENRGGIVLQDR